MPATSTGDESGFRHRHIEVGGSWLHAVETRDPELLSAGQVSVGRVRTSCGTVDPVDDGRPDGPGVPAGGV